MKDNHFNFEDLKVYRKSLELMDQVYETTLQYPGHERFNLTSQFRRAALSISLNIAEGSGATNKQNLHFLDIRKTGITMSGFKRLKVLLPNTQVHSYLDNTNPNAQKKDSEVETIFAPLSRGRKL